MMESAEISQEMMMTTREQIAEQALRLSPEDRLFLANLLRQSLEQLDGFATPEIAAAWAAEVELRADAYDRGELQGEDWEVALQRMQASLENERLMKHGIVDG